MDHWDSVMSQYAEQINRYRSDLFGEILAVLKGVISQRFSLNIDLNRLDILFSSGWRRGESLISALKTGREIDIDRGFTHSGPHRADFRITMDGAPVKEYLSRGEKKLLQILLTVSQLIHFRGEREFDPIVLMDDIFAELDQQNIGLLFALVRDLGLQLFVTATDSVEVGQYIEKGEKLFHVKQGIFTEPLQ